MNCVCRITDHVCGCSISNVLAFYFSMFCDFFKAPYLFQQVELTPDGLVVDLQVIVLLFELLLLLQHRQPVLRRLDLFVRGLDKLPRETLDLGTHPLRPGLLQQHDVGVSLLFDRHGTGINQTADLCDYGDVGLLQAA